MSNIRIIPHSGNEIPYPNCVVVHTYPKPTDNSILLASVEHILADFNSEGRIDNAWPIHIVNAQPISHDQAMTLAMRYAEHNDVPVILVVQDALGNGDHNNNRLSVTATGTIVLGKDYHNSVTKQWNKDNTSVDDREVA